MKPIRQEVFEQGFETTYDEFEQSCQVFAQGNVFPRQLQNVRCHLDPDFRFLSYGDSGQRAEQIHKFFEPSGENFIAFYASFEPIDRNRRPLVYAIIGLYRFHGVKYARDVPLNKRKQNAHTRLAGYQRDDNKDIVIFADKHGSGRLKSLIMIGEQHKNHNYYVRKELLSEWGGINSPTGWIQRSANLPNFLKPDLFLRWFDTRGPDFICENTIEY